MEIINYCTYNNLLLKLPRGGKETTMIMSFYTYVHAHEFLSEKYI